MSVCGGTAGAAPTARRVAAAPAAARALVCVLDEAMRLPGC